MTTSLKNMSTMDHSDQSNPANGYEQSYKCDISSTRNPNLIQIKIDTFQAQESTAKRNIIPKKLNDYEEYYDLSPLGGSKRRQRTTEPKSYECQFEDCRKLFHDKGAFRKHQLTHGEKQYICSDCNKKFLDNSKLRRHSLVHSGDKPFRCNICQKRFSLDFNLRTHLRIHTGEKPYACIHPGCFKRFSQSSNLTAHEKTHEMPRQASQFNAGMTMQLLPLQQPIFSQNPLKSLMNNCYSGSMSVGNLLQVNRLYELMKEGILQQNIFLSNHVNDGNDNYNPSSANQGYPSSYYQGRAQAGLNRLGSVNETGSLFKVKPANESATPGLLTKKLFVTHREKNIFEISKEEENINGTGKGNGNHSDCNQRRDVTIVYENHYKSNNNIGGLDVINEEDKQDEYRNYMGNPPNERQEEQREEIEHIEGEEIAQMEGEGDNNEGEEDDEKEEGYFAYRSWEQSFK